MRVPFRLLQGCWQVAFIVGCRDMQAALPKVGIGDLYKPAPAPFLIQVLLLRAALSFFLFPTLRRVGYMDDVNLQILLPAEYFFLPYKNLPSNAVNPLIIFSVSYIIL